MTEKGNRIRRMLVWTMVLVLALSITACGKEKTSKSGGDSKKAKSTEATEQVDNSVPVTELTVTSPVNNIRAGEDVQLEVKILPEDATNPKLEWSFSEAEEYLDVSGTNVLTAEPGSEKHDVTVTAKTTDGSNLEQSFTLKIYPELDPSKPMIAITFDDGPNPSTTNAMLDVLEENYAKGTFFVLGKNAVEYPEVVKREYDLGMEVGSHTYSHSDSPTFANMSADAQRKEIEDTNAAIEKAGVPAPTICRPPYGADNANTLSVLKEYNLVSIHWSYDTEDWKGKNPDFTYDAVMKATKDKNQDGIDDDGNGAIVLLHDIHEYNVDAVKRFVPDLIDQGYQLVTVSEIYAFRGEELVPGTRHFIPDDLKEEGTDTGEESTGVEESTEELDGE